MNGLLLIDKPAGMTSHDVVRRVRRLCKTRKVGHAGTLDPLATGVLPVAVGEATKILQFLLAENKSYRATFELGKITDTLDVQGTIVAENPLPADCRDRIAAVCAGFRGELEQVPPMYSALKKDGVPLYKLARRGESVEREPRKVVISRLEILAVDLPYVTIDVDCSKGTYIRSLVDDIGAALGCGAILTELRRLRSGRFEIESCNTLDKLQLLADSGEELPLLSLDESLGDYPAIQLEESAEQSLGYGIPPELCQCRTPRALVSAELVRLQIRGQLAAVARYAPDRQQEKRGDFELIRVFAGR